MIDFRRGGETSRVFSNSECSRQEAKRLAEKWWGFKTLMEGGRNSGENASRDHPFEGKINPPTGQYEHSDGRSEKKRSDEVLRLRIKPSN